MSQTAWVSSSCSWSQLGTRCLRENQRQTEGFGPSVTHSWAAQPECKRSAAMVRRTWAQYVAVCPCLQLTSHTQPISTLSRIKCDRYIFIKKCVRSFIEVFIIVDYVSAYICIYIYIYAAIQHTVLFLIFTTIGTAFSLARNLLN